MKKVIDSIIVKPQLLVNFYVEGTFDFVFKRITALGLICLNKYGGNSRYTGMKAFRAREVTKLGKSFFDFIKEFGSNQKES